MNSKLFVGMFIVLATAVAVGLFAIQRTPAPQPVGATPGGDFTQPVQLLGGVTYGNSKSTTTPISLTLKATDIIGFDTVLMTPTIGAITVTFPASSTLKNLVPRAGQMATQCWFNATSTAGANITFVAGTGLDFEVASTSLAAAATMAQAAVLPGNGACFRYIRKPATASAFDIEVQYVPFVDGD